MDLDWLAIYNDLCPEGIYGCVQIGLYWLCFDSDNKEVAISLNKSEDTIWEVIIPCQIVYYFNKRK